ncbi:MAG: DUF6242 domain-containing protein [Tannerella sp.]|nr:DUF6242 domain-containing protein [Tannerella sp.]
MSNCQIISFSLQNDSIPELSALKFTIDQVNGQIFNKDSMPYGMIIDRKAVCTIGYDMGLSPSAVEVVYEATKDSTYWNGTDSLDFSNPVRFRVYSYNGKFYKTYIAKVNIHRQQPDSMTWTLHSEQLAGTTVREQKVFASGDSYWMFVKNAAGYELHTSLKTDVKSWQVTALSDLSDKELSLSQLTEYAGSFYLPATDGSLYSSSDGLHWEIQAGAPNIKALSGILNAGTHVGRSSALTAVIREGDAWLFARMDENGRWETGTAVPEAFPVTGFGNVSYELMYYPHLTAVAGKDRNGRLSNVSWDTMDGLTWIRLTDEKQSFYEEREGVMLTQYDNKLFLIGGINASDRALKDIYRSEDRGITWNLADTLIVLPEVYRARGYASVLVDGEQFLLLFGGKERNGANMLEELWRGRINRLGFKE